MAANSPPSSIADISQDLDASQGLVSIDVLDETVNEEDDACWTTPELLKELTRAYVNESVAPRLLHERLDLVDAMAAELGAMDRMISGGTNKNRLRYSVHRMELYRIEHVINSYLRIRLSKIEENPALVLHEHDERIKQLLTAQRAGKSIERQSVLLDRREQQFAQNLLKANSELLSDAFLAQIPTNMRPLPVPNAKSQGMSRVFVEVLKEGLPNVPVPNMTDPNADYLIRIAKGSHCLIPFQCVDELLANGDVCLL